MQTDSANGQVGVRASLSFRLSVGRQCALLSRNCETLRQAGSDDCGCRGRHRRSDLRLPCCVDVVHYDREDVRPDGKLAVSGVGAGLRLRCAGAHCNWAGFQWDLLALRVQIAPGKSGDAAGRDVRSACSAWAALHVICEVVTKAGGDEPVFIDWRRRRRRHRHGLSAGGQPKRGGQYCE